MSVAVTAVDSFSFSDTELCSTEHVRVDYSLEIYYSSPVA